MTQTLRQFAPAPVKRAAKLGLRAAASARSQVDLATYKRRLRDRFGPGFIYDVHPDDEMFHFMQDFWDWPHHVAPMRARSDAMRVYLVSGGLMLDDLELILGDHGRKLPQVGSFLEFASGYGRFTRWLVARLEPSHVTVSDISKGAVDFDVRTFGVSGFYSAESATDIDHDRKHDVIFVASLFSHLAIEHWGAWLLRLEQLLAPGGLLIFSTHGDYAREEIYGDHFKDQLEHKAEGFSFLLTNETKGRLAEAYYGSAFVDEAFVERQVREHRLCTIRSVYLHRLWGSQDVYVLERSEA